ncbi:hypothetical protein EDD86DRAFT_88164 [Gorgonomyces haynaldii]|nr:hypothetical protein EDD86DRAFT_88164 [Gorgonomyces haynaldii]
MLQTFGCLGSWLLALCSTRSDEGCADTASCWHSNHLCMCRTFQPFLILRRLDSHPQCISLDSCPSSTLNTHQPAIWSPVQDVCPGVASDVS